MATLMLEALRSVGVAGALRQRLPRVCGLGGRARLDTRLG
jgi:hypothetical protein